MKPEVAAAIGLLVGLVTGTRFGAPFASHIVRLVIAAVGAFLLAKSKIPNFFPPNLAPIADNLGGGLLSQFAGFYFGPFFRADKEEKSVTTNRGRGRRDPRDYDDRDEHDPWDRSRRGRSDR